MLDEERKAIARQAHDAMNQKNAGLLDGHPGYWQTRQVFPLLFSAFPDVTSTVEQQTVAGEWVTTRATIRGTHLGAFMGLAPTGKAVEIMHIALDQVVHGQVVEWRNSLLSDKIDFCFFLYQIYNLTLAEVKI